MTNDEVARKLRSLEERLVKLEPKTSITPPRATRVPIYAPQVQQGELARLAEEQADLIEALKETLDGFSQAFEKRRSDRERNALGRLCTSSATTA